MNHRVEMAVLSKWETVAWPVRSSGKHKGAGQVGVDGGTWALQVGTDATDERAPPAFKSSDEFKQIQNAFKLDLMKP
jgi:hypothetical protein